MFTKNETKKVGHVYKPVRVGEIKKTVKKTDWSAIGAAIFWVFIALAILGMIVGD